MAARVDGSHPAVRFDPPARLRKIGKSPRWGLLAIIPLLFLTLFYLLPVLQVFKNSLADLPFFQPGSANIKIIYRTVGFTFWQATLSTMLTLLLGLPAAYVLYRFEFPGRKLLRVMTAIPFILPTVVVAAGINAFIGPRGWANQAIQQVFSLESPPILLVGTLTAILIAHVFYNLTIVIRLVGTAWSSLNPRLEQSARMLGASSRQSFMRITLPLLRPVIVSAALLVFIFDFTSFGVILLLGGPKFATLEVEIYQQALAYFNIPLASLLALLQMLFTLLLAITYQYFSTRPIPLVPAAEKQTLRAPQGWKQKTVIVLTVVVLIMLIAGPLFSLVGSSLIRTDANRGQRETVTTGWTLDYYQALATNPREDYFYIPPVEAIWNSLKFAAVTAMASLMLGLMMVYGFPWRGKKRALMEAMLMVPLGTSAVTLGLGYIIFFNQPPFTWGDSQWLIPMAHTLVALPFVMRGLLSAVAAIPPSYRHSAAVLGASPWKVIWLIDLPIIRRSLVSSLVFAFTISLGEFGATTFLARPEFPTLPVAIFRFLSLPGGMNYGQAMAMSTILMLVCAGGIFFIENTLFVNPVREEK
ncbi:MAG: iron ABC transporter permease [Anaerolinea sp.]|nr:iron ABC transporter permease [Anaerolinea sp.]